MATLDNAFPDAVFLDDEAYKNVTLDLNDYFTLGDGESYSIEDQPHEEMGDFRVSDPYRASDDEEDAEPHIVDITIRLENFTASVDPNDFDVLFGIPGIDSGDSTLMVVYDHELHQETGWANSRIVYNSERLSLEDYFFQEAKDNLSAIDGLQGFRVQAENAPIEDLTRVKPDRVRLFSRVVEGTERQVTIGGLHPRYLCDGEFVSTVYIPFAQADRRLLDWCVGVTADIFRQKSLNVSGLQKPKVYIPALDSKGRRIWERYDFDSDADDHTGTVAWLDVPHDPISAIVRNAQHIPHDSDDKETEVFRLANREAEGDEYEDAVLSLENEGGDMNFTDSPLNWLPRYATCLKSCRIRFRPEIRVSGSAASGGWSMITVHAAFEADRRFIESDWRATKPNP